MGKFRFVILHIHVITVTYFVIEWCVPELPLVNIMLFLLFL